MNIRNGFYLWFPVFPFLFYWGNAYFQYNFGKYVTSDIRLEAHLYFISYYFLFVLAYKYGLNLKKEPVTANKSLDDKIALKILKFSSWMLFIGTALLVYDRLASGAGSLDVVQNELSSIRTEYSDRTSFITTLAVIPQSFRIIAIGTYFFVLSRGLHVHKTLHILFLLTVALEVFNMVLSANRGALFWIISYGFFYIFYIKKINPIKFVFSLKYIKVKLILVAAVIIAYSYFVWVAENRVVAATTEYLGQQAFYKIMGNDNGGADVDYIRLAGEYQIFYYITHGFEYLNAILKHAPYFNIDVISPLGIRVESNLNRIYEGYQFPAKVNILNWVVAEGLSPSGWPTIFGASLAYFGVLGSLLFSIMLGLIAGKIVRNWLKTRRLGWLILTLLVFSSLNMSFDWIMRNFDQYFAIAAGLILIYKKKSTSENSRCVPQNRC